LTNEQVDARNCNIFIIGPQNLQNEFFTYVIQKELSFPCYLYDKELNPLRSGTAAKAEEAVGKTLLLIDVEFHCFEEIIEAASAKPLFTDSYVALINLKENTGIEKKALSKNVRGFFYKDDHFELFLKGVRNILNGEVWISRSVLLQCVYDGLRDKQGEPEARSCLTTREVEILSLVSQGASNDEIARKMFISTNTVKTHLYNIFKKINVTNRLQASQWATLNILA